ncbi:protein phosphatase 1 regulatory subunit 3A-like isoform X2 [Lineus longissimus]
MVEDAPPHWIYLPRNLSYVGDQVWDYFVCCKNKRVRGHTRMEITMASPELKAPDLASPSSTSDEDSPQTNNIMSPDDSGHVEDIFGNLKLVKDETDCDLSSCHGVANGKSDGGYGSDDLNSLTSADSDQTLMSGDDITLIISSEDETDIETGKPVNLDDAITDTEKGGMKIPKLLTGANSSRTTAMMKPYLLDLLNPSEAYEDDDEDDVDGEFGGPPELRRATSLKTNKTPPGTPRRKKVVRFADAFGLDLENVRHILNMNSPPRIPASAVRDLKAGIEKDRQSQGNKYFQSLFSQPGATGNFVQRVLAQNVCLENAMINGMTITGTVRVKNVGFHKKVTIRYTVNSWATFADVVGSYVQGSCDGATDRFSFTVVSPGELDIGKKLEFAVMFECGGQTFWDNNYGQNYVFECYAKNVPTLSTDHAWVHFL